MLLSNRVGRVTGAWLLLAACVPGIARAQVRIDAEAVLGQPLGVGRLTVEVSKELLPEPLGIEGLGITERNGRVLYPALQNPVLGAIMREALEAGTPLTTGGPVREGVSGLLKDLLNRPKTTIYFLFRGEGPLQITFQSRVAQPIVVTPRANPAAHRRLLTAWWRQYAAPRRVLQKKPDYPPLVENYLTTTLARRLNLPLPPEQQAAPPYARFEHELGVLTGSESVRLGLQQDRILGLNDLALPADQPLPPPPPTPPPSAAPEPPADTPIEPIARHVPAECFYVRFGSFANFLWFQDTLDTWGGDLQNLVAMRGLDYGRSRRIQEQLVLRQSQLSRLLGDTVIADVAIIGTDLYFTDGAAFGFLFQARNDMMLTTDLTAQRFQRVQRGGVSEQKLTIGGRSVSLLISPDGGVRSYYGSRDGYHFVTTSKALMARFLETSGAGSLGASKDFRHARAIMPLVRNDTAFVYFSDAFFGNITGPHYRTETMRRLEAATDIELVLLAKLAAAAEGKPGGTIEELIAGGLLPAGFGPRPDGSRAVIGQGVVYDQLRGHRGAMTPVPDVPVQRVTAAEAASYRRFADFYQAQWGRLDPMMIAVRRTAQPKNREQVVIDVVAAPFAPRHHQFLAQWVGPPDKTRLAPVPGNLAAGEVVMTRQRLFGGLQDVALSLDIPDGRFLPWLRLRNMLPGYIGTVGELGILAVLNATIVTPPDPAGLARGRLGIWRQQSGRFTVFSFQPEVLAQVTPQLRLEAAQRPAQVRMQIGDPSQSQMAKFLNNLAYSRGRQSSLGNLRLMHQLDQQLHVPPADAKAAAEFLLAAKLVCPLGGQYTLAKDPQGGAEHWTSTALARGVQPGRLVPQAPEGYLAPPLTWFRGLDLEATMTESALSAHAEVIMQMPKK